MIRIGKLNSGTCGTQLLDTDFLFQNLICPCGGRIPTSEHVSPIILLNTATNLQINPSFYAAFVNREGESGNLSSFSAFPVAVHVLETTFFAFSGNNGSLIIRIPSIYTQSGAVLPAGGVNVGQFEFLEGVFGCDDIKNALGADGFVVLAEVLDGNVIDGPVIDLCLDGVDLNLGGTAQICGLLEGSTDDCAVTLGQVRAMIGETDCVFSSGLNGESVGAFRTLSFCPCLDAISVEIYEITGGSSTLLVSLPAGSEEYTFVSATGGVFQARCVKADGTIVFSNEVQFSSAQNITIPCNFYGDGSDGSFSGGDLQAGNVYQFTDFSVSGVTITLQGQGNTIILVQNDLVLDSADVFLPISDEKFGEITVCGQDYTFDNPDSLSGGGGSGGTGLVRPACAVSWCSVGVTGATGGGFIAGNPQNGQDGSVNCFGFGGSIGGEAGINAVFPDLNGTDGQNGQSVGGCAAAAGGGAGGNGANRGVLLFLVGGNVMFDAATTFLGQGGNGGSGGSGGWTYVPANGGSIQCSAGGGGPLAGAGGGGGGGRGGNGGNVVVFHAGTVVNSANVLLTGGNGGNGGSGGLPGRQSACDGTIQTGTAGFSGMAGQNGADGALQFVPL